MHKTTILCQFGLFCHQLTTISPSILNHFWWELYQVLAQHSGPTSQRSCMTLGSYPLALTQTCGADQLLSLTALRIFEYILCYVDDLLAISHDAQKVLKSVQDTFKFKDNKIDKPDVYLGAQLVKMSVDGFEGLTMSSEKYIKLAIENIEQTLVETNQHLPTKCRTPLSSGYRPELDTSPELKTEGLQRYQELIGILHWAVELGRVNILLETALMSTHLALPR